MQLILPPSETKHASGSGQPLNLTQLTLATELGQARSAVIETLESLSQDIDAAAQALKVGVKARSEIAHNLTLRTAATLPAIERYTGVLYDSLNVRNLSDAAREWIRTHVSIQSALFGLTGAFDQIPAYRLSASSRLSIDGKPLKRFWQAAHSTLKPDQTSFTLDLRSKGYAALAPIPDAVSLNVVERTDTGQVRALNHFNKAGKGRLVRSLAETQAEIQTVRDLTDWASDHRIEILEDDPSQLTLVTTRT